MQHDTDPTRPSRRRRLALVAAAAATVLAAAACTSGGTAPSDDDPPTDALAAFHDQELDWGDCDAIATTAADAELYANPALECASATVPLDYADPEGETGRIAMLRLPATGGDPEGSLLVNPGGPGASGASFVASLAPVWQSRAFGERFDIVGFDPRGVGATEPAVDCDADAEYDAGDGLEGFAAFEVTSAEEAEAFAERCVDGSDGAAALTRVGSTNVVQDMDVMRAALGDEQLTFLGYSYGSEIGAMYAEAFPERVRAIVLDGAVDPSITIDEFRLQQMEAFQSTFDDLATTCAQQADCPLGTDPAAASERMRNIVAQLDASPAPTTDGRGLRGIDALTGVLAALYAQSSWPQAIQGLADALAGSGDGLQALRDGYYLRGPDGAYGLDTDANAAIRCMDWPRRSPEEQGALVDRIVDVAPVLDVDADGAFHHECESWPEAPTRDEAWLTGDVDVPPILVVSVTGHPATPHAGGIAMAQMLDGALLEVDGAQHGGYVLGGSACVDETVEAYLLELDLPEAGARCSL